MPPLVERFVERNAPRASDSTAVVRFRQVGEMQLKPGRWVRFAAEQEASVERVEFSWRARFPLARLLALRVHDWYRSGDGGLEVRLLGLPVKRVRGPEVARGEAVRYLAELPWFPQACVRNRELEWREVDGETVEVATEVGSSRAAVRLQFDDAGDVVAASADARPRAVGKQTVDTPFRGEFRDYGIVGGARVPTAAEVRWELPDGPFAYFRCRLLEPG